MRPNSYERTRTMGLLHRFFRTALLVGRMPSLLGREIFRTRSQNLPARAFEDSVLFVCDVERCLRQLEPLEQRLIAFCVLEDRSEWEAARRLRCSQSDVSRRLGYALDTLHETFCRLGLLKRPVTTEASDGAHT
jgi:hypothetical protein